MKIIYSILLMALITKSDRVNAQIEKKVLFIGNSFTAANDLQGLVHQFFDMGARPVITFAYAPGGISVGDVAMGAAAHMNNPYVFELIREKEWDYMVLQDNQGRFALDSAKFPSTAASKVIEGHLKIRDSLQYYHPCAKMIWFSGWGLKEADSGLSWIDSITVNYRVMNDSAKDVIAPIGAAWRALVFDNPLMIDLWDTDGAHPSMEGSFLSAAVIYGAITGEDLNTNPFNASIAPPVATHLKMIAQKVLADPLIHQKSNLKGIATTPLSWDPSSSQLSGASGYLSYRWYRNNTFVTETTDSTFYPIISGAYRLWVQDDLGYWLKSCTEMVAISMAIEPLELQQSALISPNPTTGQVQMSGISAAVSTVEIYSMLGARVQQLKPSTATFGFDLGPLPSGVYFVKSFDVQHHELGSAQKLIKL